MSSPARDRILERLQGAPRQEIPRPEAPPPLAAAPDRGARVARLKSLLEAMRAEVHVVPSPEWLPRLKDLLRTRSLQTLVYAPDTSIGAALRAAWEEDPSGLPALVPYDRPVEAFKETLFAADAAVTTAAGAVADAGAIILRPDAHEPRLMSLVPPLHIAVLAADAIYPSLGDALREGGWSADMPTNLILVSGPSKTADIELTLAFGVHGPKELVVLILE
jgi:L-lactate dehydrogenase complex protein LldG